MDLFGTVEYKEGLEMEFSNNDLAWAREKVARIVRPVLVMIMQQDITRMIEDMRTRQQMENLQKKINRKLPPNWPKG